MLSSRVLSLIKPPENPVIVLTYYCIKVYFFEHFEKKSKSYLCGMKCAPQYS